MTNQLDIEAAEAATALDELSSPTPSEAYRAVRRFGVRPALGAVYSKLSGATGSLPAGGSTGEVLTKASNADGDVGWEPGGGSQPIGESGSRVRVGLSPANIAITLDGSKLYVGNGGAGTVTVIDTATMLPIVTLDTAGDVNYEVIVSHDGSTVYVTGQLVDGGPDSAITPIDVATDTLGDPIPLPGVNAYSLALTLDDATLYVSESTNNTVIPIDVGTGVLGDPISVGNLPDALVISLDGATLYCANEGENTVTPIDTATNTPGDDITVGTGPSRLALSPDGATLYCVAGGDGTVTPIDTATNTPGDPIILPGDTDSLGNTPQGIAVAPNGHTAYASNSNQTLTQASTGYCFKIDLDNGEVIAVIPVGRSPFGLVFSPDGAKLYCANGGESTVSVIATA